MVGGAGEDLVVGGGGGRGRRTACCRGGGGGGGGRLEGRGDAELGTAAALDGQPLLPLVVVALCRLEELVVCGVVCGVVCDVVCGA